MASSRRVSASLKDLRRIYRAGAKGLKVSLAAMVPGSPARRKKRNAPKKKHAKRSNAKGTKRKKALRTKKRSRR